MVVRLADPADWRLTNYIDGFENLRVPSGHSRGEILPLNL